MLTRLVTLGVVILGAIVILQLTSGRRGEEAAALAALDRANREMVTKVGWGVREAGDLEWITRLGRGDSRAWELIVARDGSLDLELEFAPSSNAVIRTPVVSGQRVYVVFRPRLGESGLVMHRQPRDGSARVGEMSWDVDSVRWGACVSVLAPGAGTKPIEVETHGGETVSWDRTRGSYVSQRRPYFGSSLGGIDLEGTPRSGIAVPASARITGIEAPTLPSGWVSLLPSSTEGSGELPSPGDATILVGMTFPMQPDSIIDLLRLTWSARISDTSAPSAVARWILRASLRATGAASGGR